VRHTDDPSDRRFPPIDVEPSSPARRAGLLKRQRKAEEKPRANGDGGYLPMPWDGARRIENERKRYRQAQRLHRELFPDYDAGWRRPSETTTKRVWGLVASDVTLTTGWLSSSIERQALVVALDAAIQAGQDGRLLTHNLVFDAVAAAWSDNYRAAIKRGSARVSYEMSEATLTGAWRDLKREEIDLARIIKIAQHGCGLYKVEQGHDDKYTVKLTGSTEQQRQQLLNIVANDSATGGTYRRRTSLRRLRLPDADDTDALEALAAEPEQEGAYDEADEWSEATNDATTRKVVAGVAYNVAVPGERSLKIIHQLESARLYLNARAVKDEHNRLIDLADEGAVEAYKKYSVDITKSTAKRERVVIDAGTLQPRKGYFPSALELELRKLGRRPDEAVLDEIKALQKKYNRLEGQVRQLGAVVGQIDEIEKARGVDEQGEIAISTRYTKLVNRRYQALDFWPTEVSGKDKRQTLMGQFPVTRGRRGLMFRADASAKPNTGNVVADLLGDERQELYGFDVSGSQIAIFSVLLGLRPLEDALRQQSFKELASRRAWKRDSDPSDLFKLPDGHDYDRNGDDRLKEALKSATMTYLYGSPIAMVVERLKAKPDEFGRGLGTARNLGYFLNDTELQLDQIKRRWMKACARIARLAHQYDDYAGVTFTDPFDVMPVRWNPVRWTLEPVAGSGGVRIRAKVPLAETRIGAIDKRGRKCKRSVWIAVDPDQQLRPGYNGDPPVDRHKLSTSFGACFIHTLDAAFCGLVLEQLRDVPGVVAIHDAFLGPQDASGKIRAAIKKAGELWFEKLGGVYDDLERLLGECRPPTRGPRKGRCCDHCGRWIQKLRGMWKRRMEGRDFPDFRVGKVQPYDLPQI
jgi:hypothetical protein